MSVLPPTGLNSLVDTARVLLADDKGLLAIDESIRQHTSGGVPFLTVLAEALTIWGGQDANLVHAQQALHRRATADRDARRSVCRLPPALVGS